MVADPVSVGEVGILMARERVPISGLCRSGRCEDCEDVYCGHFCHKPSVELTEAIRKLREESKKNAEFV